jgi:hypothetical protein
LMLSKWKKYSIRIAEVIYDQGLTINRLTG